MAFWLAKARKGQDSDYIQRFDPVYWTVNFPRPMMASVTTSAPDTLRVDCEFLHEGELAGLIWESEDRLDHPLLAYRTDRDYARTTLRFRWRSSGIVALDQPNGPTLTIEGRDAGGNARSWYVRLWNYAAGTPTDAEITLPFSQLESGYGLPGEQIHPGDIDRMFISLVPDGYVAGSEARLPGLATGWAEISGTRCEGDRPMLQIGDIALPPHGEQIATGYDDAYNQAPARLIRSIEALGYRGRILHYVGMSHFMRLLDGAGQDDGRLLAAANGALCVPAKAWHLDFLQKAQAAEFEVVFSLSYELLAEHCPNAWQQRAADGEPARTGWVPPSALLSPASSKAVNWLKLAAYRFAYLQEQAGHPVRFQIGEPWWWVMPDGRPCLYDDAAVAAFGGAPVVIPTMRAALDPAATALLDQAGVLLAQSTAEIAATVRGVAPGAAEVMLLAFTPTILDPDMPELKRANLPPGWAYPAFDRLQLEDYDWLTAGADARRRAAYAEVDARLGYPVAKQDYLSGFVLDPDDAEVFWPRIDDALDEAAERGINQRYVWALPQVSRDGYTRLAPTQEDELQAFDDVLYPLALGRDTSVSPEFSTSVATTASGHERRNSLWSDARLRFDVGPGIRSEAETGTLLTFFRARRGPARGFRLADPFDFSSSGMTGSPTATDQLLGIGDGTQSVFDLIKTYGVGPEPQLRIISRPRVETITVSIDGVAATGWSWRAGGQIEFGSAPAAGAEIRAGFLFDVPVRFAEDRLDISGANFAAGEAPSVPLVEIREER
uniref:DUF2460 domain-containing protein n=1 Tax=Parerythrobacter lutipelagi TaxID=1964208 RepID=UPI0010F98E20|nr:DUF2460 domain-containing protein [Parerythrobacter lutipelagi]